MPGIEANLYALRCLTKEEKHSIDPQIARRQITTFCLIMNTYPDDTYIGGAAAAALGAMPGDQLTKSPEFGLLLKKLISDIKQGSPSAQTAAICAINHIVQDGDENILQLLTASGGIEALFQALDAFGENKAVRLEILNALHAVASMSVYYKYYCRSLMIINVCIRSS